jgi:DNA polymerase (family 10)
MSEAVRPHEASGPVILLAAGIAIGAALAKKLASIDGVARADLAGSIRRAVEVSHDVDLVLTADDPPAVIDRVIRRMRFATVEERSPSWCRLRFPNGILVDVYACAPSDRAAVLVNVTGSRAHVDKLRARARSRQLELTPNGLASATGAPVALEDEHELYARLGLTWIPPELREDIGEIEEAAIGEINLVEGDEVRGFVHCHSSWSDGSCSIEELARAAEARGAQFITITDHSRAARYAGGLDVERLRRQWDEIDEVQSRVAIRILKGSEADILADGALDWPDPILEQLEVVIASVHDRHRQDESAMTDRLLRAMRWPIFKIWGHPLGRLIMTRPPIACRVEEVLDALAESRGAIEICGDPRRLDIEPRWARQAHERGIPFVLSVDAHTPSELDNLRYAVALGRRSGLRRADILNTRGATKFARIVRPAGRARRAA